MTADLTSFANGSYTLQFFASNTCDASGFGEGERLIGHFNGHAAPATSQLFMSEAVPAGQRITATATDANGNTSEFSACVEVDPTITIVSNTNDGGAGSLRAAIEAANSSPGQQTISFNIPGVSPVTPANISLASPLPQLTDPVIIDGSTQPGYDGVPVIEIHPNAGQPWAGFDLQASNITIRGLSLGNFADAILGFQGLTGHVIEQNLIGTTRAFSENFGNTRGIQWRANNGTIRNNVISGNQEGLVVLLGASATTIQSNLIGVGHNGITPLQNTGNGITMFDGVQQTLLTGNTIAHNGGWGVDLQFAGNQVSNTTFQLNVIGLDANGNDAGNFLGGIRLDRAPGTQIGAPGFRNIIAGNGGNQPQEIGVGIQVLGVVNPRPVIQSNYIGLDPTGVFARSNNNKGIVLDGNALVGGGNNGEGNYLAGNGDASGGAGIIANLGATSSEIVGNVIGLNVNNVPVGNGYSGITVRTAGAIKIGGAGALRNIISGNGLYGISVLRIVPTDPLPSGTTIENNMIGTDASGTQSLGNGSAGISIEGTSHRIGGHGGIPGNVIANNGGGGGIRVIGDTSQVEITLNTIRNNGGLGIDLAGNGVTLNDGGDTDLGPNGLQNYALITTAANDVATAVTIDTNELAPGNYTVQLFSMPVCDASGHGEGDTPRLLVTGVAGGSGLQTYNLQQLVPEGHFITATITNGANQTSEFSPCSVVLKSMTLSAPSSLVGVGRSLTGTITLAQPAPAGGLAVNLVSGNTNFVTVSPATVTIAQGGTTGTFTINGVAAGTSTITASAAGASNATLNITTTTSSLISLGNPPVIAPGQTSGVAVSLGIDAPAGGVTITFTSSDTNVATITPSVFIPAGLRIPAANPQITGVVPGTTSFTANAAGFAPDTKVITVTVTLNFTPPTNFAVITGRTANITLNLSSPAPAGGLTLNTSIDNPAFATVPATVSVAAGTTSVQVPVTGVAVGNTTIRASGTGIAQTTATVRVDPTPPINIGNATIGKDLQEAMAGSIGLAAPAGGVVVTITSLDPARVLLATAANVAGSASITRTVSAGSTSIPSFWVHALAGTGTSDIQATASGYANDTSTITMQPSGFILNMGNLNTNTFAANTTIRVDAAMLNATTLNYQQSQPLRGGVTANVTVTSSDTNVGTIVGSPAVFNAGDTLNFATAFNPATTGTSTISITTPAGFQTPNNLQSITATVTAPNISVSSATVGRDLQEGVSISLGATPPSPLTVTVTSNNGAIATITKDGTVAGGTSLTFTNVTSTSVGSFFVQGRGLGSTTLTVQAAGYNDGTSTITVNPSGFILNMGNLNTNTFAANTTVRVDAALLNATTLNYQQSQPLRGGVTANVVVTSSDTNVGAIVGSPAVFNAGDTLNFATAFDPATAGTSTISITRRPASRRRTTSSRSLRRSPRRTFR